MGGGYSPGKDKTEEALGIDCEAALALTGTFTPSAAKPVDVLGCWPVGTWKFHAAVDTTDCKAVPVLSATDYIFTVNRDADGNDIVTFVNDPTNQKVNLKITGGDGGVCMGNLEIFSPDGKILTNLKPSMGADGKLTGHGDYEVYYTSKR